MKKITISLNGDTYRRARMKAAEQNTSVSALVKRYLTELTSGKTETKRRKREECELRARISAFTAGDRLLREDTDEAPARACSALRLCWSSWPALCRPSMSFFAAKQDVDGRDERGHDGDRVNLIGTRSSSAAQ